MVVHVRDVITCFKFGDDRLRGLASAEGQILPFPIDFDGRPYNTLTLPCERVIVSLTDNQYLQQYHRHTDLRHGRRIHRSWGSYLPTFYTVEVRGYINSLQLFNNTTCLQSCNVVFPALRHRTAIITARCTLVQSTVLRSHCRLSVRLSVTLVDCDHIGWNSSKLISPLVSLGCSLFASPT